MESWTQEADMCVSLNEDGILDQAEAAENPGYFDTFNAPYVAGFSEKLAKDLRNINVGATF